MPQSAEPSPDPHEVIPLSKQSHDDGEIPPTKIRMLSEIDEKEREMLTIKVCNEEIVTS